MRVWEHLRVVCNFCYNLCKYEKFICINVQGLWESYVRCTVTFCLILYIHIQTLHAHACALRTTFQYHLAFMWNVECFVDSSYYEELKSNSRPLVWSRGLRLICRQVNTESTLILLCLYASLDFLWVDTFQCVPTALCQGAKGRGVKLAITVWQSWRVHWQFFGWKLLKVLHQCFCHNSAFHLDVFVTVPCLSFTNSDVSAGPAETHSMVLLCWCVFLNWPSCCTLLDANWFWYFSLLFHLSCCQ